MSFGGPRATLGGVPWGVLKESLGVPQGCPRMSSGCPRDTLGKTWGGGIGSPMGALEESRGALGSVLGVSKG